MKCYKIQIEDNGQDFTSIVTDVFGVVIDAIPFQRDIWMGAYVPIDLVIIGDELPIHHPPNIRWGFLKHKVLSIEEGDYDYD